jgi:hypothetical protein
MSYPYNSPRDTFYRSFCYYEKEYYAMIDWIMENNSACYNSETPEAWACDVVHRCISMILFGNEGNSNAGTGMCNAVRVSMNVDSPSYKKVWLLASVTLAKPKPPALLLADISS